MKLPGLDLALKRLPAPLPLWRGTVDASQWDAAAAAVAAGGGRLVALWGGDRGDGEGGTASALFVCAAYALQGGLAWLELALPVGEPPRYPDVSKHFPAALRMQRACADLLGFEAEAAPDHRPWLDHGAWPRNARGADTDTRWRPLRRDAGEPDLAQASDPGDYDFVRVEGDGVHEIAVGPVHAGTIEPGHFRFSVVGEKVLRLGQRLGYTHKGIERRFTELAPLDAHLLAARVVGDSTVAFGWAYCMALESAAGCRVPARAAALRALLLERERVANHLGDLGALGNDAAFGFGLNRSCARRRAASARWRRVSSGAFQAKWHSRSKGSASGWSLLAASSSKLMPRSVNSRSTSLRVPGSAQADSSASRVGNRVRTARPEYSVYFTTCSFLPSVSRSYTKWPMTSTSPPSM